VKWNNTVMCKLSYSTSFTLLITFALTNNQLLVTQLATQEVLHWCSHFVFVVYRRFVFVLLVSTPDGASELLDDVDARLQQRENSSLVQGTPVYGPRTLQRTMDKTRLLCSIINVKLIFNWTDVDCRMLCTFVQCTTILRSRYICNLYRHIDPSLF